MNGWIKLHRQFLQWEWFSDPNVLSVFVYLLLQANRKDSKWRGHEVLCGQHITSNEIISLHTGLSVQMVRTALRKLKSTGEITTQATNKFTLVTIVKWAFYQGGADDCNTQNSNQTTNNQHANDTQPTNEQHSINNKQEVKEKENRKNVRSGENPMPPLADEVDSPPSLSQPVGFEAEKPNIGKASVDTQKQADKKAVTEKSDTIAIRKYPHCLAFFLDRDNGSILVYLKGKIAYEYYLSETEGRWRIRAYDDLLQMVTNRRNFNASQKLSIEQIFNVIWWLSYKKIGTMLVMTDTINADRMRNEKSSSRAGRKISRPIGFLMDKGLIYDLATLDGAILIDYDGMVHYAGVQFNYQKSPRSETLCEVVANKGTRHNQAAYIAAEESQTLVFVVSENRGISVFYDSDSVFFDQ